MPKSYKKKCIFKIFFSDKGWRRACEALEIVEGGIRSESSPSVLCHDCDGGLRLSVVSGAWCPDG